MDKNINPEQEPLLNKWNITLQQLWCWLWSNQSFEQVPCEVLLNDEEEVSSYEMIKISEFESQQSFRSVLLLVFT